MSSTISSGLRYPVEGTAALKASPTERFRVYEGGAARAPHARHGRLRQVAFLLVALCLGAALGLGIAGADSLREASAIRLIEAAPKEVVTVAAGDSLWSIAESHPVRGVATKGVLTWIERVNHLDSPDISVGEKLVVPVLQK